MRGSIRWWPLVLLFAAVAPLIAKPHWELRYFYDVDNSELTILDFAFPSPARGVAVGYLTNKRRSIKPCIVLTSDGGKNWSVLRTKERGLSIFFLNERTGWMVTNKGIWQTFETGRDWRKISKLRGILRVFFVNEQRGWATGVEKSIYETVDGGKNWTRVPVADAPDTTKKYTVYSWIDFADRDHGTIVGFSNPPDKRRSRFPDWMDPEHAAREHPKLIIIIQTTDGGKTWKSSVTSVFGRLTRLRVGPDGRGLALLRFQHNFRWPSEVYSLDLQSEVQTKRVFRKSNRCITDIMRMNNGVSYLAGFIPPGKLFNSPVPGRLVVLRSRDLRDWKEMDVDYRAYAHNAIFAAPGQRDLWLATDTGMILKLVDN